MFKVSTSKKKDRTDFSPEGFVSESGLSFVPTLSVRGHFSEQLRGSGKLSQARGVYVTTDKFPLGLHHSQGPDVVFATH